MNIIAKAKEFAIKHHGEQMYGDHPYSYHLEMVAGAARLFTRDPVCVVVAWLHDVLEDTDVKYRELCKVFGPTISEAVLALSNQEGKNRLEKHLNTYWEIRQNKIALAVKLCDRLSNMQESSGSAIGEMYKKEYLQFKFALYEPGEWQGLWSAMDNIYEDLNEEIK